MVNFFTALGVWFETNGFNTFEIILTLAVVVTFLGVWAAIAEKHWVAYSLNPTRTTRLEFIVAVAAPLTVPVIAAMVATKWFSDRKAVNA